jgi:dienelactone hydrolase
MSLWPHIEDENERQRMLARAADVWAADLSAVLDAISAGDLPIDVHVDSGRIGLAGHSLGGTAVGKLSRDDRIGGIVVMEGDVRQSDDEDARGSLRVRVPLLHLIGGYNRLELERRSYLPGTGAPVFTAVVRGTGHAYFSDLIHLYRAWADRDWRERHRYEVDPDRVIRIASDYMAAFFDWSLKGEPPGVLLRRPTLSERVAGPREGGYPEVDLSIALH